MHSTSSSGQHQSNRIRTHRKNITCQHIFSYPEQNSADEEGNHLIPKHRDRLCSPLTTLSLSATQAMNEDRSCQNTVNQVAIQHISDGQIPPSVQTGGYCRARQRIPVDFVQQKTKRLGTDLQEQAEPSRLWRDRHVKIVDGTTATMPDTAANQEEFPQQGAQKPGLGFPVCRIVGITCLATGALSDAAVGKFNGKGGSEQVLLRQIADHFQSGDIVLADAFFPTYFLSVYLMSRYVDILMEQHGSRKRVTDFRKGKRPGERDHLIEIKKPEICPKWMSEAQYDAEPDAVILREFKASGKIMITTLLNHKAYPESELKALYKRRWNVELDIRFIKDVMGMNILSCKTPEMVKKEIRVYLLAYNFIRYLMVQSALPADIPPRPISFKRCVQLWLNFNADHLASGLGLQPLFKLMARNRVGNRPGRIEPGAVKRRPKAYPLLTKKRSSAREEIRKNGHPEKHK